MANYTVFRALETLGYLFYVVSPNRTSFETIDEVPDYVIEVVPFFATLIFLEQYLIYRKKTAKLRINDGVSSISQGMLQELLKVVTRGIQFVAYFYIYENWRLATLPWNSLWTWWTAFLLVDFLYYWFHRACHEVNILWASHQVHHSSEDYNLSTALRQAVLQNYTGWIFYLPMALAVPPSAFLVHNQFNLLYQFWIHTEVIDKLGPLEYILNTASHHRVHHGRNRYCIDKNYGGTLIIWDRIFGTFEAENEKVVYGLTHPINTFQPFQIQLCHYVHMWKMFWEVKGVKNKLSVIFKGPGWAPGKPWHGLPEDIPDVHAPIEKYDPQLPLWCNVYIGIHFLLIFAGHIEITEQYNFFPSAIVFCIVAYQIYSLATIGALLDGRAYGAWMELVRCLLFFILDMQVLPLTRLGRSTSFFAWFFEQFLRIVFLISTLLWTWISMRTVTIRLYSKKLD